MAKEKHVHANPDDRSDNVEKLQSMVQDTIENIERSHDALKFATAEEREQIEAKNHRREESIQAFRNEIRDEFHQQEDQ
ncbi:spore protein [Pontibacillus halophilus JSM 076056 = DSM 19796]|uniref:Small, acid-soluble spore protein Tlp n=1 Tax=Pontibacillus halophilus JSM 076056 = DSM 19796 TaxID=1385510 RepID=A0A0A5GJ96_9BACI|nr:small acid-soluble spore protein Tlp [Pontibacillus halophilus]KGX92049.1 spore protein [Pontibacillus halophilus JSM 076056 = DSM 19796]